MAESPARSSISSFIATLPISSQPEPFHNCTTEYILEPLNAFQNIQSINLAGQTGAKSKKSANPSTSKSKSPAASPRPSSPIPDAPEVDQARELCATAAQEAKSRPDMAYKMFAKAGQLFAKHYRTKEAAQAYFSVVQLQTALLRTKSSELLPKSTGVPSLLEIATEYPQMSANGQQLAGGVTVLFKSYLYLARLFRPHDTSMSQRMFWNCLETVVPSTSWATMGQLFTQGASPTFVPSAPSSSRFQLLSQYSEHLKNTLEPVLAFVTSQRRMAAPEALSLEKEIALVANELAGFISPREASPTSVFLYEFSIAVLNLKEDSPSEDRHDAKLFFERLSTIFGGLKMAHWQSDCLLECSYLSSTQDERDIYWCKSVDAASSIDDHVRLRKLVKGRSSKGRDVVGLTTALLESILNGDSSLVEDLELEPWVQAIAANDLQIFELLQLAKARA